MEGTDRGNKGFGSTGIKTTSESESVQSESKISQDIKSSSINQSVMTKTQRMNGAIPVCQKKRSQIEKTRQIISARQLQKLAKNDTPIFLAIVRTNDLPIRQRKRSQNREAKFAAAHGITEGQKRQINKKTGPKKDFVSVEEREQQVLASIPERHRKDLELLINEYRDVFPEKLPKGVPPPREV